MTRLVILIMLAIWQTVVSSSSLRGTEQEHRLSAQSIMGGTIPITPKPEKISAAAVEDIADSKRPRDENGIRKNET